MTHAADRQQAVERAPAQVLALGSLHGDDRVAWCAADRLRSDGRLAGRVHCISSPWDLVDHLRSEGTVLILDTCRSGTPRGTLVQLSEQQLEKLPVHGTSSHGGSVAESLRLARALEGLHADVTVLTVEIDEPVPDLDLTLAGREAVTKLEDAARRFLADRNLMA